MAAAVQIQISVDPTDSGAKIGAVKGELEGLGTAGVAAGTKAGQGMQQMTGHVATGLDSVRLLSQEFGLRMPRAIEAMLSRMPGVTSALSSIIGIMGGIAAIEIFARAIDGALKFYNHLFDVNAAMREYLDKAGKAAESRFVDEASIETARASIESLNAEIDKLDQRRVASGVDQQLGGLTQYIDVLARNLPGAPTNIASSPHYSKADGVERAQAAQQQAAEAARVNDLKRQYAQEDLKTQAKINEAGLTGAALVAQKLKDAHTQNIAAQQAELANEKDQAAAMQKMLDLQHQMGVKDPAKLVKVPQVAGDAGSEVRARADASAEADAKSGYAEISKQNAEKEREAQLQIMQYRHEAAEAGLKDEALLSRKRIDETEQIEARMHGTIEATAVIRSAEMEIDAKYYAGVQQLADETGAKEIAEQNKVALEMKRLRIEAMHEGLDKISAQHDLQMDRNNIELSGPLRETANAANDQEAAQKAADYKQKQDEAEASRVAKINDLETQYVARAAEAQRRVRQDGLTGWVADYKDSVDAIIVQDNAETQRLMKNATDLKMSQEEIGRAKANIDAQANAQIDAQNQDLQRKIAGTLESAFKDPIGTIKSEMEKLMFDILANWLLHLKAFQSVFGHLTGGMVPGGVQQIGAGIPGVIQNLIHGGAGGGAASVAGSMSPAAGSSLAGSAAGTQYRPAYSGNSGLVTGAGSSSSIGSDLSSVRGLTGYFGGGASDGTPAVAMPDAANPGGNVFDDQGNVTNTGTIASQPVPQFQVGGGGGLGTAMGVLGAAGAAYSAEQTTVSAFDQGSAKGVLSGTLGDAAAGATIGSVIPGIGTAVGAAVGAAVGFASGLAGAVLGMGGRIAARDYYEKTLFPSIEADRLGQGGDPMSAASDVNRTSSQGYLYMQNHWGEAAAVWVKQNYMDKEVALALSQISQHAAGGEQYTQRQAVQFHGGGYIDGFGDLGTSSTEGYIHALMGESINNQRATSMHAPVINAMNSGASPSDVAAMYLRSVQPGSSSSTAAPSGGDTHFHIHTLDTKTMTGWLRGGGAQMITKAQNNLAGQYAGEGVIG